MLARNQRSAWWRKRRTITGGLVVALIVATGGGTAAAYAYLHPRAVTNKGSARCYSEAVYVRGATFAGTTIATAAGGGSDGSIHDALDTCASLWQVGALRLGVPHVIPPVSGSSTRYPRWLAARFATAPPPCFPAPLAPATSWASHRSHHPPSGLPNRRL